MGQRLRWRHKWGWWVDLALVGLVALAVRCYRLSTVPTGLNRDAAANGLYALDLLRQGIWPFFVLHMGVAEPLMVYLQSASIALLGPGIVALRVVSALAGALTACGVYVLGRVLWPSTEGSWVRGRYAAFIAGLGLALCPLHFHVSRMGLRAILSPLLQAVTLTFFWYAWQTGKRWAFALAGLTLGLGMYSYLAFRATLLLLPLLVAYLLLVDHSALRKRWRGLVLMGICAAVWVLPAIPFFAKYPMALWGRAKEVTLSQQPLIAQQGTGRVVLLKLWAQIKMFVLPWSGQYNLMGFALLDPALLVAFCVGLVVACAQIRHSSNILLLLGLPVTLIPALLADDLEPHGLRELGVVLFVYLLIGLGAATIAADGYIRRWMGKRWARLNGRVGQAGLAIVVISGSCVQFCRYQAFWDPAVSRTDSVHYNLADIAEARYLTEADMPVLVPLAEYERTVLRYLSSSRFLVRASDLDQAGQVRVDMNGQDLAVLMPRDPDRKRLEGPTFSYDGAQYALLTDRKVYVLPPLDRRGEEAVAAWMSRAQVRPVRDPYGRDVAAVYTGSGMDLTFVHMADPLDANLSGQIWLRGYTLSDWHLEPGGEVTLALFWQAQHKLTKDYRLFVHLLGQDEQVLIWGDTTPGQGVYPTILWSPDETVSTFHRLSVPADLSPGRYQIEAGFYDRLSLDRIPIVDGRGRAVADRVLVGPLKVPINSPPIEDARLAGEALASGGLGRLGEAIVLAGYEPAQQEPGEWVVRSGDVISLRLEWAALARPAADYTCFVHLSAPDERILAQHDAQPLGGAYPTSIWERGEVIVDEVSLVIPQGAEPGTYSLWTGMYNSLDNVRLPATDLTGQRLLNDRIRLGSLRVLGAGQ